MNLMLELWQEALSLAIVTASQQALPIGREALRQTTTCCSGLPLTSAQRYCRAARQFVQLWDPWHEDPLCSVHIKIECCLSFTTTDATHTER